MILKKHTSGDYSRPKWLDTLVGSLHLDFVAPYPLEEASRLLKAQERRGFFRYHKVVVDLIPYDPDTYAFYVKKYRHKNPPFVAHGYLKRWDRKTTRVTGRIDAEDFHYHFLVAYLLIAVTISVESIRLPRPSIVLIGIVIVSWLIMWHNYYDVARLIEQALDADASEDDNPIKRGRKSEVQPGKHKSSEIPVNRFLKTRSLR